MRKKEKSPLVEQNTETPKIADNAFVLTKVVGADLQLTFAEGKAPAWLKTGEQLWMKKIGFVDNLVSDGTVASIIAKFRDIGNLGDNASTFVIGLVKMMLDVSNTLYVVRPGVIPAKRFRSVDDVRDVMSDDEIVQFANTYKDHFAVSATEKKS